MDESTQRTPTLSALKAAQATLAAGLTRLRVAGTERPNAPPIGEGESLARVMGLPGAREEATGGGLSSSFFPGGVGLGVSSRGSTILPSTATGDSFTVIRGLEDQVASPLSFAPGDHYEAQYGGLRGEPSRSSLPGRFGDPRPISFGGLHDSPGGGFDVFSTTTGRDPGHHSVHTSQPLTTRQRERACALYGPHNPSTGICGGVITRGAQGQFPDRFCLKIGCGFPTHVTKSYLPRMLIGGYYVKQNDSYGFAELVLSPEAAALAPEGLLQVPNTTAAWKAIIRQLEDQLSEGVTAPEVAAEQAAGLAEFARRVLKTPYATTPMRSCRRTLPEEEDESAREDETGTLESLQRLEDGMASLRGEIGIWAPAARYITLHGGVGELGSTVHALQQDVIGVLQEVSTASAQAVDARDEARRVQAALTALGGDASQAISNLRGELATAKSEREALESTVLTLSAAVTTLMTQAGLGPGGGITQSSLDERFRLHNEAVNGRLDIIRQEMKGGGDHGRGSPFLRSGGGLGLGPNQPTPKHLPVHRGDDLRHVPDFRGRGTPRGYDETRGARGTGQANLHAVCPGALGPHSLPSCLGWIKNDPT